MANLQIRVDDNLKTRAQQVVEELGIDLSSAIRIFLSQLVKENGFPFIPTNDPFFTSRNQAALRQSALQIAAGNVVNKSLEELRSME